MNVALVGSSGYIASFLLKRFAKESHIKKILSIDQNGTAEVYLNLLDPQKFNYDILNAIDKINADNIYVLPNNKNIILAAQQTNVHPILIGVGQLTLLVQVIS